MRKKYIFISMMLMACAVNAIAEPQEISTPMLTSTVAPAVTVAPSTKADMNLSVSAPEQANAVPLEAISPVHPLVTPLTPMPAKNDRRPDDASSDDIKQLIMGLISVIILIFILYFFIKKIPGMKVLGNPHMKVISVMNVGVKEKIALIQVGERVFLLGITAHNISYLHEFVTADVLFAQTQSVDVNVTFQKMMQKIFERRPS